MSEPDYDDPWAEQARRHDAHVAASPPSRWRRLAPIGAVFGALLLVAAVIWVAGSGGDDGGEASSDPAPGTDDGPAGTGDPTAGTGGSTAGSTVPEEDLVVLEDVWLLDREDGVYDWGVILVSSDDDDRERVTVTASLLDQSGSIVTVESGEIALLPARGRVAVGGEVSGLSAEPVRVEAEVVVGVSLGFAGSGAVDITSLGRQGDSLSAAGDALTGSLVSTLSSDVAGVRVAAVWRDEEGAVVAAVFHDVGVVTPTVVTPFAIPLPESIVPEGLPADAMVSR